MKTALVLFLLATTIGCVKPRAELGTRENPIKFFLVPSVEQKMLEDSAHSLKNYLESQTPYHFQFSVPTSYIAVVEAFGSKRADVASLNTYGYYLAHKKFQAQARLTVIRAGESTYRSQILVRADGPIQQLKDLNGKKFAFVDPTSASGYLLPTKLFIDNGVKLGSTVFAQRHDNVISMIYQRQVDGGATYYSPPLNGKIQDSRMLVLAQYPNVEKEIKILQLTDPIPNDPIVFRQDLPEDMKNKIAAAMIEFVKTDSGRTALEKTFAVTGFKPTTDQEYDPTRKLFAELGEKADAQTKGK